MINKSILDAFERFWFHVSAKLGNKADIDHTHDDRYFTETEANGFLANKADKTHTHSIANVTNLQSSLDSKASTSHTHNSIEVLDTRNDNPAPSESDFDKKKITADFKYISKIGSPVGFSGTYCGLISFAPWTETSGGHGYQMAFGYGGTGIPRLAIRASDLSATAWNSWYKIYTSADKPTKADIGLSSVEDKSSATIRGELTKDNVVKALGYTPPTTNTTYSVGTTSALGLTKLYAGTGTATDGTMTQAAINAALVGKANSSHTHSYLPLSGGTLTGEVKFDAAYPITFTGATYQQRINVVDDSTENTNVFEFQQSTDSGETFSTLMSIKNNGQVVANTFVGNLSGNASSASSVAWGNVTGKPSTFYTLPTASSSTLGGVKTTSTVTSTSGLTACPIIGGVPYYKDTNTTYSLDSFGITATAAELNCCDGVTSNIQTQLNGKANSSHSHTKSQITDFPTALKNPAALTINGTVYDGSEAKSITISGSWSGLTGKPDLLNCMRMYGGTALDSKGTTAADTASQYDTITLSTATAATVGFNKVLTDLPKGKYSIMIRLKISNNTNTGNILKVECGDTAALKTFYIKPTMFNAKNTYQTFGFTVDHNTTSLTAKLSVGTALASVTANIDYVAIAPTFTAITSVA